MKKIILIVCIVLFIMANAQKTANRFFYELTYKPKKNSEVSEKVITILDITDKKSIYEDYTIRSQDSIVKKMAEKAEKTGIWPDMSQFLKSPKFEHKIIKSYPEMKEQYQDKIGWDFFVYDENIKFNWKILPEKEKIGDYNTQKATTDFAGREWTAWFAAEIPFQDGPYKFYGLPGLIVKIEDSGKNYSWILDGNKKIENYDEASCVQRIFETEDRHFNVTTKEKFVKAYEEHRADPLRELKARITPEEMNGIMPGGTETVRAALKNEEKKTQDFLNANNNPIEIIQPRNKKEK